MEIVDVAPLSRCRITTTRQLKWTDKFGKLVERAHQIRARLSAKSGYYSGDPRLSLAPQEPNSTFYYYYTEMDVDASNQRDVWLVKVPKYLANTWKSAPQRAQLGRLQLPKGGVGPVKFIIDPKLQQQQPNGQEATQIPGEHSLTLQSLAHQRMVVLSQTSDKISFEGEVKHRGELRPKGDISYMSLKASSIKLAAKPIRTSQIVERAFNSYTPRSATQLAHEADLRKRKDDAKKLIREDKEIVQGRLFGAFEKQQYYNIKDLVRITNQPTPYLKDVLKEICIHCSRGTNKGMYELKPEYRHYKSASGSQSAGGGKP